MGTILLIDDSKLSRLKTSKYIRNAGYDVIEAENGQVGLELAIREHPDCIVCDILMPVMDGFEFTRRFKETGSDIPIIIMTADIQNSTRERIKKLGSSIVLTKPPKEEALIEAIESSITL